MVSSNVSPGDTLLASQFNNLRTDVINTSTGHDHDGSDSKLISADDLLGRVIIKKDSDELVDNSTTLQNDDDFSFAIAANEVWVGRLFLKMEDEGGGDTPGVKLSWSLPSGGAHFSIGSFYDDSTNALGEIQGGTGDFMAFGINFADNDFVIVDFSIVNGANAGTVQFQWAQGTASTNGTIIAADSFMIAHREA